MVSQVRYNVYGTLIICLLGLLIYSNTFETPLVFDDGHVIASNQTIQTLSRIDRIFSYSPKRFLPYLSFAVNYHFHQTDVFGYHLINLLIHVLTSLVVWRLARLIFHNPVAGVDSKAGIGPDLMALFAGLIFVAHPIQTQAVTYITQRMASMAGLFYIMTVWLYGKARGMGSRSADTDIEALKAGPPSGFSCHSSAVYYALSLLTALAGAHTKETTLSLPAAIILYELCFCEPTRKREWLRIIPYVMIVALIPMYHIGPALLNNSSGGASAGDALNNVAVRTLETQQISRLDYILTECRVLITYLRLLVLPINQNLDYDYPIYTSLFQLPVLLSVMGLSGLAISAIAAFKRYRVWTFAVFWFFITLSVESGLIPIIDVINEYRLYATTALLAILVPWFVLRAYAALHKN